ncbi:MAG: extracellular elastinolytic metalloproteinase [Frankiales bacterium]|jgi:hypothetical protein|nr:extracellular elastinolytic metalloproteinase [Frankiales bacterium]
MRRRPVAIFLAGVVIAGFTTVGFASAPTGANQLRRVGLTGDFNAFLGGKPDVADVDTRGGATPSAAVLAAARALGANVDVTYNEFGTATSIVSTSPGGWVSRGLQANAVKAARSWISTHRALFNLTDADLAGLRLVNDAVLPNSKDAHAVLFGQTWSGRTTVEGGLVAVGIRDGNVAIVTSTLAGGLRLNTNTPRLNARSAVLAAARDVGFKDLSLGDLHALPADHTNFTLFGAKTLTGPQRTRLAALPTPEGVRLVYETNISKTRGGAVLAVISFVDASNGRILVRRNAVDTLSAVSGSPSQATLPVDTAAPGAFTASFEVDGCGPKVEIDVPQGSTALQVIAQAVVPSNDFELNVYQNGNSIGTSDLISTEAVNATLPVPSAANDVFEVEVCPTSGTQVGAYIPPFTVTGVYNASDVTVPTDTANLPYPPIWKYFPDSPKLGADNDTRTTACWTSKQSDLGVNKNLSGCQQSVGSIASRAPWDVLVQAGLPTFTTIGNNAFTADAWAGSTLTPGPLGYHPVSPTRDYLFNFSDQWFESKCDPTSFVTPDRVDIDAAVTNLFTGHNLVHDFAYYLGFTEQNSNFQVYNYGLTPPLRELDPEIGSVQSGAITNEPIVVVSGATGEGVPVTGRDNANQITEQDGVPGITNQYLFQPVHGFYAPCHDGDLDMSIYGHEYTHGISNRMIAGPDTGLSGHQGGSMGESWSDLNALELMHEYGFAGLHGEPPDSVGAYATGNHQRGIRDYQLSKNPLNYSDIGFDGTGDEVHADGEIWNGTQWAVRQALINKWNAQYPATNKALQLGCATGKTAAGAPAPQFDGCPGNRRWIQYVFTSFLLQANGAPTMLQMRDTMLASAVLYGSNSDATTMGNAFASRGMGVNATSENSDDTDPVPGFASRTAANNARVTFNLVNAATGAKVPGDVYVGHYQARVTPLASTIGGKTHPPATANMIAGTYDFVVRAAGYGLQRFKATYKAGVPYTQTFRLFENFASKAKGAVATGTGERPLDLIDDNEDTNAYFDGNGSSTDIAGHTWTVDLSGGKHLIGRIAVSALHHPGPEDVLGNPLPGQARITDLRSFTIQASSDGGQTYKTVYTSPSDFFPGVRPRATAPDLILRTVSIKPVVADHVRLVVQTNQCTGGPAFRGDQDNDPLNNADCPSSEDARRVTATELEVFAPASAVAPPTTPTTPQPSVRGSDTPSLPTSGLGVWVPVTALLLLITAGVVRRRRDGAD